MKKRKFLIGLVLLGLVVAVGALSRLSFADSDETSTNHAMGSFINGNVTSSSESSSSSAASSRTRSITAAAAPTAANLYSTNASLPRQDVVDVASYQSWMTQSDFNALKADGVKTIVVKLTEGTGYINPYARQEITYAKNAGLNIAAYHFVDTSNAAAEANYFINEARALGLPSNTVMVEDAENTGAGISNWTSFSQTFANTLKSAGYINVRFYTSPTWVSNGTMNASALGNSNMWLAYYLYGTPSNTNLQYTQYGAWQFSSQMYFAGVQNNPLDVSIDYDNIFVGASRPAPGNVTIANGLYTLKSGNRALDIVGGGTMDGNRVQSYAANGTGAQLWQVTRQSTGYYTLQNPQSGRYLDVWQAGTTLGTPVDIFDGNGTFAQQWAIYQNTSGGYSLLSLTSGLALDISGNSMANGTPVQTYTSNNTSAQGWTFTPASTSTPIANGTYSLTNASSNYALDVSDAGTASGTNVQIWQSNGTGAQKWKFTKLADGNYSIINTNSGKSLDIEYAGVTNGTNVWIYNVNGTRAQEWIVTPCAGGFTIRTALSGLALDVTGDIIKNGTNVQSYAANGTNAQVWKLHLVQ